MKIHTQDDKPRRLKKIGKQPNNRSEWVLCKYEDGFYNLTWYNYKIKKWMNGFSNLNPTDKFQWVYTEEVFKQEKV